MFVIHLKHKQINFNIFEDDKNYLLILFKERDMQYIYA